MREVRGIVKYLMTIVKRHRLPAILTFFIKKVNNPLAGSYKTAIFERFLGRNGPKCA
jgi:hypothetical protein